MKKPDEFKLADTILKQVKFINIECKGSNKSYISVECRKPRNCPLINGLDGDADHELISHALDEVMLTLARRLNGWNDGVVTVKPDGDYRIYFDFDQPYTLVFDFNCSRRAPKR